MGGLRFLHPLAVAQACYLGDGHERSVCFMRGGWGVRSIPVGATEPEAAHEQARRQPHGPPITWEWAELRCDTPHVLAVTWRAPGRAKPSAEAELTGAVTQGRSGVHVQHINSR